MRSETEPQAAEDTVVIADPGAPENVAEPGAPDDGWPVAELYRVEPEDEVVNDRVAEDETVTLDATTEPPAPAQRRLPGLGAALLAILVAVGAILLAAVLLPSRSEGQSPRRSSNTTPASSPPAQTTTTATETLPRLAGTTVGDARRLLDGLRMNVRVRSVPSQRPVGLVLRQQPRAGTVAREGGAVTLVVSDGPQAPASVRVPSVVGRAASDAVAELREAGFVATIHLVQSTKDAGIVLRQSPAEAAEAARGSAIRLDVARARPIPQRVETPDLVGMTVAEARRQLAALGLTVEIVRLSSSRPTGTVLRQAPRAGSRLAEKSRVTLTVSSGPENVDVPDVVGLDEASAQAELEKQGFEVRVTYEPTTDPMTDGTVVRQAPSAGSSARPGSAITIVVAQLG